MPISRILRTNHSVRYPSALRYAAVARRAVYEYARAHGLSEDACQDMRFAVGEAIANALEHGHREGTYFSVRCTWEGRDLVVEVEDDGPGYDPSRSEGAEKPANSMRGYGMTIMRALTDRVAYQDKGRAVRLFKFVGAEKAPESRAADAP